MIEPITFDRGPDILDTRDILTLDGIEKYRKRFTKYSFNGASIPRVNEILSQVIGKEYLCLWAARLGEDAYKEEKKLATMTGTFVHEAIEYFLLHHKDKRMVIYSPKIRELANNSYNNFKRWYETQCKLGYILTPIYTEVQTTNPWFGGTIDLVLNIKHSLFDTNMNFIIDFKTSKSISVDYILQTYAYMWSWNWNKEFIDNSLLSIDGIGIIRIDKYTDKFEDLFITLKNNPHIMKDLNYDLGSMINWYYSQINANYNLSISRKISKESNIYGETLIN